MKRESELIIRSGRPDMDEGLNYAKMLNETAEGFIQMILGKRAYSIISKAYVKTGNEYSHENVTLLTKDNRVVGMISGYTSEGKEKFTKQVPFNMRTLNYHLSIGIFSALFGPKGKGDYYIQALYVDQKMRGQGLGSKLMKYIEDMAHSMGAKSISLDVTSKNEKAIALYKRQGFEANNVKSRFFIRMSKPI